MRGTPAAARVCILAAVVCAVCCTLPVYAADAPVPWGTTALLAALGLGSELAARRRHAGGSLTVGAGSSVPLLLAAAFLLPPAAAALVAVPGALAGRVERPPYAARRIWRAAQLALTCAAASWVHTALGGPATLGGPGLAPDFPLALLPVCAASVAFSLVLTALDGVILAAAERRPVHRTWRGLLPRALGPHLVHALSGLLMAVLWRSSYGPVSALFVLLPMSVSCWVFAQYHRERAAHRATIRALVHAVDIKDTYTRGHSERVGRASVLIARELGMDDSRVEALRFAGILHDIGKLGVPTRVLRKDGPLTSEERRIMELHPEYGHEIVRGIAFLDEARDAILHHHERLDGSGYPYGLRGSRIPEFARVVAVADAFDAMTSNRSYRRARPVPAALAELKRCAGSQFDPRMVRALGRALDRHGWSAADTAVTADEPGGAEDGTRREAAQVPGARSAGHGAPGSAPRPSPSPGGRR
ncbi:HD-GYP domain-containing protein [Streptomyces sp. C11-1]|uniref:HD-GYP domain-containing protein n=1 Tax=Streptomyces durocortorensis TaxID=2811104 RepID=A0ABY9W632_9ACTN|nr:HD-GYP domain-containing protein [Streptomyces durocortorensis]WNF29477.1 HD-GYP domain-containing protein [Streptomyces durocortorensis]